MLHPPVTSQSFISVYISKQCFIVIYQHTKLCVDIFNRLQCLRVCDKFACNCIQELAIIDSTVHFTFHPDYRYVNVYSYTFYYASNVVSSSSLLSQASSHLHAMASLTSVVKCGGYHHKKYVDRSAFQYPHLFLSCVSLCGQVVALFSNSQHQNVLSYLR